MEKPMLFTTQCIRSNIMELKKKYFNSLVQGVIQVHHTSVSSCIQEVVTILTNVKFVYLSLDFL